MKKKILINAANLHSGGGVQVATSFVSELASQDLRDIHVSAWISTEVYSSLVELDSPALSILDLEVVNLHGIRARLSEVNASVSCFDLVFTIFGPNYLKKSSYVDLVGFAQLWILDDSGYAILSTFDRFYYRAKFFLQKLFFKRADALIVELEHVRDGVCSKGIAAPENVHIVRNCLSPIYFNADAWRPLALQINSNKFKIGFVGRDYVHKNTQILPAVIRFLAEKHGIFADFFVTFDATEWERKSEDFKSSIINVGSLSISECPSFYEAMDAVIFPSLLECFSVTPLEAMVMGKPLFASDRRFVRDVCGDHAIYFDPSSAESAADTIAHYVNNYFGFDSERLSAAKKCAIEFSSSKLRARQYLDAVRIELDKASAKKN